MTTLHGLSRLDSALRRRKRRSAGGHVNSILRHCFSLFWRCSTLQHLAWPQLPCPGMPVAKCNAQAANVMSGQDSRFSSLFQIAHLAPFLRRAAHLTHACQHGPDHHQTARQSPCDAPLNPPWYPVDLPLNLPLRFDRKHFFHRRPLTMA